MLLVATLIVLIVVLVFVLLFWPWRREREVVVVGQPFWPATYYNWYGGYGGYGQRWGPGRRHRRW